MQPTRTDYDKHSQKKALRNKWSRHRPPSYWSRLCSSASTCWCRGSAIDLENTYQTINSSLLTCPKSFRFLQPRPHSSQTIFLNHLEKNIRSFLPTNLNHRIAVPFTSAQSYQHPKQVSARTPWLPQVFSKLLRKNTRSFLLTNLNHRIAIPFTSAQSNKLPKQVSARTPRLWQSF